MDKLTGEYGPGRFGGVPWYIYEVGMALRGHTQTIRGDLMPSEKEQTPMTCSHCGTRGHVHFFCYLKITLGSGRDYANYNHKAWNLEGSCRIESTMG